MAKESEAALLHDIDMLRAALKVAEATIRRLRRGQALDTSGITRMLERVRAEAHPTARDPGKPG